MWKALVSLILGAVKWLWGGRQQAEGEAQGKSEQTVVDQGQELRNVAKADTARNSVSDDPGSVSSDPDNSGPASGG